MNHIRFSDRCAVQCSTSNLPDPFLPLHLPTINSDSNDVRIHPHPPPPSLYSFPPNRSLPPLNPIPHNTPHPPSSNLHSKPCSPQTLPCSCQPSPLPKTPPLRNLPSHPTNSLINHSRRLRPNWLSTLQDPTSLTCASSPIRRGHFHPHVRP